jgi:hypothetical protein
MGLEGAFAHLIETRKADKNRLHTPFNALSVPKSMSRNLSQRLFTAFAFMALAGILAFGGGIRYFCYCAGTAVLTLHEHCHGEHGEQSHLDHAVPGHRHDDHEGDHEEEEHEDHHHELVKFSTDLRLTDVVVAPELRLIPLLWTSLSEWETVGNTTSFSERPRPEMAEDPPPLSLQVARAVVRLI